jgi:hypothetical protein
MDAMPIKQMLYNLGEYNLGEPRYRGSGYSLQPLRAFMLRIQSLRRVRCYPSRKTPILINKKGASQILEK